MASPLKTLAALAALLTFWRIASNRKFNREYAQLPDAQKRLIPRRWL